MGSIFLWFADRVSFGFDWILLLFSLDWISNFYWLTLREKKMAPIGSARTSAFSFHHQQPKKKKERTLWLVEKRSARTNGGCARHSWNELNFVSVVGFFFIFFGGCFVGSSNRSINGAERVEARRDCDNYYEKIWVFFCFFFFYSVNDPIFSIKFFEFFGTGCQSWWSILFVSLLFCFYNSMADGWLFLLFVRPAHRCGR